VDAAVVVLQEPFSIERRHRVLPSRNVNSYRKAGCAEQAHVDSHRQSVSGEICLILPPSERTCRRLSQDVASRETSRNRKVINSPPDDIQNREPHKDRQQRP
jgi:hypothetical protein